MSTTSRLSDALLGRTIVITVERRADELAAALERHGAVVRRAPALATESNPDDAELLARTRDLIARPPQDLVVLTGIGLRGWLEAADAAGLRAELHAALAGARIVARGAKAQGAVQGAGLETAWVAPSETSAEVGEHLVARGVGGRRIAVQHHGTGADGLDESLGEGGADVVSLTVYRSGPTREPEALRRSVQHAAAGPLDAVVFTSAPAAAAWLEDAVTAGCLEGLRERASAGELVLACVGPVTARPLTDRGMPVLLAARGRTGALVRAVVEHFEEAG
ncbi:uroporphyrinogen-III synthase [Brachybacterium sacelli]|uniref:Uroporphyrinogen-III synthase n=1 Tax=Brachybacterium sacelli TaxID=173364 RepID=A0ABS4X6H1_9MICO|nr:uroporphyrinogen-III synthase [Brachybacterium sacelli]MBP2384044.1 uroporphyrinogen-III synthase [Brachybacterium sacelli]